MTALLANHSMSRLQASRLGPFVVAAATFVLTYACVMLPRGDGGVASIWAPNAVLVAVMLRSPRAKWIAYLSMGAIGMLAGNFAADGAAPLKSLVLAGCNTVEIWLAVLLITRRFGGPPDMSTARSVIAYDLIALAPAVLSAVAAATFLSLGFDAPWGANVLSWALADYLGLVTITPCLLVLFSSRRGAGTSRSAWLWPMLTLVVVCGTVFMQTKYPLTYLVAAALLLVAYRVRLAGAAAGVLLVLTIAVAASALGHGPFAGMDASFSEKVLLLQVFLAVCFNLSVPVALVRQNAEAAQTQISEALATATAAEAKYREIANAVPDIIMQVGRSGRITYASPSVRTLGYDPHQLVGALGQAFVHPSDRRVLLGVRRAAFATGKTPTYRVRIRTEAGDYRWLEGRPSVLQGEDGKPRGLETVFRDVTDAVAAQRALSASESRYRALAENITDIVASYGRDGVIQYVSPSVRVLGYSPEELVGQPIVRLLHPDDVERVGAVFASHREDGPAGADFRVEYRMFRKDGSMGWFEAHPRAIVAPDTGEFVEWQDVVRDISDQKALETQLRAAKTEAEAISRAKTDFLADISHEMRTPLTGVLGFTQLASAAQGLAEPARTYVRRVDEASQMLLKLVNDILDFTKLEAGQMTFRAEPVDASELGRSCLRMFEGQALGKGLQLRMVDDLPAGARLELDPDRMRQVLLNLLSNAVKFTERGSVTLRMALDATKRTLRIDVCDTGRGIPADRQAGVFDRFSQAHQEERRYGGTGLGLAICRSIVEGVGGTISVASEVGSGSRFTVTIPIRSTSVEPASTQGSGSGKISVLVATGVADDGKRVQDLLEGRLDLSIATDEEDAVRLADAQPYDVLLFGLEMRGAGAAETLKRIRAGTGPNKDTPALALDADAATNGEALRALGFAGGVVKPVTAADLMSTLAATLMQARVGP